MTRVLALILVMVTFAGGAQAAGVRYYEDPVYKQLAPEDPHPMEDLVNLADQGDTRAQFIIADLYGKGKGGLAKNQVKSRYWFETAARKGYTMAFIRLAAMAKRNKDYVGAYKWYSLSMDDGTSRERKWSDKAREKLVKDAKLSKDDIRSAREDMNDWKSKRQQALAEEREHAQAAREAAKLNDADTPKVLGGTGQKPRPQPSQSTRPKKEHGFNE
jgi:TPR repeat protein